MAVCSLGASIKSNCLSLCVLLANATCVNAVSSQRFVRSESNNDGVVSTVIDRVMQNFDSGASRQRQSVHWVFVTDCSAYMFNQGNLMLASAHYVDQPGEFTWITYGCERDEQKDAFKKLAHPRAKAWHAKATELKDPVSGKPYAHFQASNRPVSIAAWWRETQPTEDAIAILDPDMMWLRPVNLFDAPRETKEEHGPWETSAARPKQGSGARYGQGCVPKRWSDSTMLDICSGDERCVAAKNSAQCSTLYSSGPPWILHHSDAEDVLSSWTDIAVKVHANYPEMLAEQVSFGVTQMRYGVTNALDPFWFVSNAEAGDQPWNALLNIDYDPCAERVPPPSQLSLPPLWHSCSTYEIPHLQGQGYRLHKDHIHKDLLDCNAPLLHYPPRDALMTYKGGKTSSLGFRNTWSVCAYTNLVNFHASAWKKQYCEQPNLEASFVYPPHASSFLNESSWLKHVFRKGGWTDVDYKISR